MTQVGVLAAAVWGPGLEGWDASAAILAGHTPYEPRPSMPPAPSVLPPNERRRAGPVVRLALTVAGEASAASGLPPASLRCVFGSGNGDGPVVGGILEALATGAERVVSPTAFHNSVHNAAAGYWSIANGSAQPATCLGCGDATWAAALLAAVADVRASRQPVLLVAYDHPMPAPLDAARPTLAAFATALVLTPEPSRMGAIAVRFEPGPMDGGGAPLCTGLRDLAAGNPAARALRLLEALARGAPADCPAPYLSGHLHVQFVPC